MIGRILVFIAGLFALVLFVALLAPYFIDWSGFRQDFEQRASQILGKKVEVHGAVSARLIPFPSVTMEDVTIGKDGDGKPLVTASRFAMDMEIAPFLSGEARIFEMRIIEPKVHLSLQKDGSLDWVKTGNPSIPAKVVVLENVHVTGGELIFEDHQTGRTRHLSGLDFTASAKSLAGPWIFDGRGELEGHAGQFRINTGIRDNKGEIKVAAHVVPDGLTLTTDLEGTLKLENLRLRYNGNFTASYGAADKGPAPARVKGTFELANDRIRLRQYQLDLGSAADPYSIDGEATLDTGSAPQFLLTAEGQQVDMNAIGASGEDGKKGRQASVEPASVRIEEFLALLADIPVPQVPGKATLKLPAIVSADTTFRDIMVEAEPLNDSWKINQASVELPGRTKLEANGVLKLAGDRSFAGTLAAASSQPSGLSTWLAGDVAPELRALNAVGFSADVNLTETDQRFENLELAAGGAILKGRVERQSAGEATPTLAIDLAGGDLDLDALKAMASLVTGKDSSDAFFSHSIAATLNLENLASQGTVAKKVQTAFKLADGKLVVDRLSVGDITGAAIDLTGSASGTLDKPVVALTGHVKAGSPRGLMLLAQSRLPQHPVLDALVRNAFYLGNTNLDFDVATAAKGDFPVVVKLKGTSSDTDLALTLSAQDVGLSPGTNLSVELTAQNQNYATLLGQAGLTPLPSMDGGRGNVSLKVERDGTDPADITLNFTTDSTGFNAKGKGDLTAAHFLQGDYKILLDSVDIEPFLLIEGRSLPGMGNGLPLTVTAELSVKPDGIGIGAITGKSDAETFTGNLNYAVGTSPRLTGEFGVSTADAAWLAELVTGPLFDEKGAFSARPLLPHQDGALAVDVALKANRFWAGYPTPIEKLAGRLTYDGGSISLVDATGELSGGKAKGSVSLTTGDGQAFLRGRLDVASADARAFSWTLGSVVPVLSGRADAMLVLESSGANIRQLANQLSGSGNVAFPTLDINGLDASALPKILDAAGKIDGDITAPKVQPLAGMIVGTGRTHLEAFKLPFTIASGHLRVQNAASDAGPARIAFDGDYSIADAVVNAGLRLAFNPGDDAPSGAEPAISLKFSGPFATPSTTVDVTELTGFLSLRALEAERRKADILQSNIAEKQRLRREALYFKAVDDAREQARIEAERKAALEAEQQKAAAEKAAADKAAADKAAAEKANGGTPEPFVLPAPTAKDLSPTGSTLLAPNSN